MSGRVFQLNVRPRASAVRLRPSLPRKLKPSQTCPACGRQAKKTLSHRTHRCQCGLVEGRDLAAARVVLNWALSELGREPTVRGVTASAAG